MASNNQAEGGYDLNFVEDPPDALKCLICLMVVRDPQQHGECGKLYCKSCISEYRQLKNDCPHCRQTLTTFNDGRSAQEVKSLKIMCDNLKNGCQWVGELVNREDHLQTCKLALLPCTNECKKENEIVKVLRKDLQDHLTNKCPRRQYPCPHCKEKGEYKERTTTHIEDCPQIEITCPNKCGEKVPRCQVTTHRTDCSHEMVSCKYKELGCATMQHRKDIVKHQEQNQLHLEMAMTTVVDLQEKAKKPVIHILASQDKFVFRLVDYSKKKRKNTVYYSSPFYTHSRGYTMCASIYANGTGGGKGTHVTVGACLMKGDNDDFLTWPFTGTVTVELLNQLEDKNHYKIRITFPADNAESKRVMDGERGQGYGQTTFISHADLDHKPDKNCQYLKDDMLFFRVSVTVPHRKPWLDCTP